MKENVKKCIEKMLFVYFILFNWPFFKWQYKSNQNLKAVLDFAVLKMFFLKQYKWHV